MPGRSHTCNLWQSRMSPPSAVPLKLFLTSLPEEIIGPHPTNLEPLSRTTTYYYHHGQLIPCGEEPPMPDLAWVTERFTELDIVAALVRIGPAKLRPLKPLVNIDG